MPDKSVLVFKYGGNAMTREDLKTEIIRRICRWRQAGYHVVIVHGGGPTIQTLLDQVGISSTFIDGHRQTTPEAMRYVEMALKGQVNGELVSLVNQAGVKGVGLCGKDGQMVVAEKKRTQQDIDLGRVGNVAEVKPDLIRSLLANNYVPVVTCVADSVEGETFNINADLFAGHLAGALHADEFVVLTDVDGLMEDLNDPQSVIRHMTLPTLRSLRLSGEIKGGMIPKLEACEIALDRGANRARILNGTQPEQLDRLFENPAPGTLFTKT